MKVFYEPKFNPIECSACGTIFSVEADDNIIATDHSANGLMTDCPTCGEMCPVSVYAPEEAWNDIKDDYPPKRALFIAKGLDDSKIYYCDRHDNNGFACSLPSSEMIRFRKWVAID